MGGEPGSTLWHLQPFITALQPFFIFFFFSPML